MAWLIARGQTYFEAGCFFLRAEYFLKKTTSGITYYCPFQSTLTIEKLSRRFIILKSAGIFSFYLSPSGCASWIHLFISPAITTSSHFFSSAFISRSSLNDSILLSLLSSFTKPDFKKVFVILSQVVLILVLSPPPLRLNYLIIDSSQLFLPVLLAFELLFIVGISLKLLAVDNRKDFIGLLPFHKPNPANECTLSLSSSPSFFSSIVSSLLNLYPNFLQTVSANIQYCIDLPPSQIQSASIP